MAGYDYGSDWINPDKTGLGAGILGIGGGLANMFGGTRGRNPTSAAQDYLGQIPGTLEPLKQRYNSLDTNPGQTYNQFASGYQKSPGYDFALKQALGAVNNSAAAGGTLGTPMNQQVAGNVAGGLASHDFENYLNHVMQLHGEGLIGSNDIAKILTELLGTQAQYGYAGQAGENQASSQGFSDIFSGISGLLPLLGL